ncbi:MAG TPA: nucleotide exchange factor GrpE [Nevskiaceae bacterium]|nr:nucleotide exchange factor GrpE [Nevskiaceae bacterium]
MTDPTTDPAAAPSTPPPSSEASAAESLAALQRQLAEAEARAQASKDAHLRALAELDNVRKRAEREISQAGKFGAEKLLGELLGICDSLDLGLAAASRPDAAVAALAEGMTLTRQQLLAVLEKHGVSVVDPQGQPFNPDLHEAISAVPSAEVAPNHVLTVMQKGYRLHERLLRPAMVVVAKAA